jgi:hypothetical protein
MSDDIHRPHFTSSANDVSPRKPKFKASSIHVVFAVCKVTLGRVFLPVLYFRGAAGRIILKWIFKKWDGEAWT